MRTTAVSLALLVLAAATALAQVPRTINYQGRIASPGNPPINGPKKMTLRLYSTATGGTPFFEEEQDVVFNNGVFTVAIGGGPSGGIPPTVHFDEQYWLGVEIEDFNSGQEMVPRFILRSSPYAFRSILSDSAAVAGSAVTAGFADSSKSTDMADSAMALRAPAVLDQSASGTTPTLSVNNGKGPGLVVTGTPYASIHNGVDSTTRHYIAAERAGGTAVPTPGGYYRDNAPIAWGSIDRTGNIISDFGIASVTVQNDSTFKIVLDNAVQLNDALLPQPPQFAPMITVGNVFSNSFDAQPAYAVWGYERAAGETYAPNIILVRFYTIQAGGQGTAAKRPFSIVVFGRP